MTLRARPAVAADYPSYARLFPELGTGDPLPSPAAWSSTQRPTTRIYEHAGSVVAYAYFERMHALAYVRNIVVDPTHRGQGLGLALMRLLADELRSAGCTAWCLNVDPRNTAAVRLYHRIGLRHHHRAFAIRLDWSALANLAFENLPLGTCPIDPLDDPALEATFDLPPGQLASLRSKPGRRNLRLRDPADPAAALGFASFDPSFPGAYPFRVVRPGLAPLLLRPLQPHAPPGTCMLVIEDDEPLYARLLAAGATLRLEISHMRGPLIS